MQLAQHRETAPACAQDADLRPRVERFLRGRDARTEVVGYTRIEIIIDYNIGRKERANSSRADAEASPHSSHSTAIDIPLFSIEILRDLEDPRSVTKSYD